MDSQSKQTPETTRVLVAQVSIALKNNKVNDHSVTTILNAVRSDNISLDDLKGMVEDGCLPDRLKEKGVTESQQITRCRTAIISLTRDVVYPPVPVQKTPN
jgi:hypothetical protein